LARKIPDDADCLPAYASPMNDLLSLTSVQLNHAAKLKEQIEKLGSELASLLGSQPPTLKRGPGRPRKARLAAEPPKTKRRRMSPEARAKIAAAAKKRWAKAKAQGKTSL